MPQYPNQIGFYRDGTYRRAVETISTATTRFSPTEEQSGTLFVVPEITTLAIALPSVSSRWLGLVYEFFVEEQATSDDVQIDASINKVNGVIMMNFSSQVDDSSRIMLDSTFATGIRLTAVSSVRWMGEAISGRGGYAFSSVATDAGGTWSTA